MRKDGGKWHISVYMDFSAKKPYEDALKSNGYSSVAEEVREHIRTVIKNAAD